MDPVTTLTSQDFEAPPPFERAAAWVWRLFVGNRDDGCPFCCGADSMAHLPIPGRTRAYTVRVAPAKSPVMAGRANAARQQIRDGWARLFRELDVLLMKVTPEAAPPHLITIRFARQISRLVRQCCVPPGFA
ncbi:hypothetical protein B0G77_3377 [Paraburkholderia sp. BL10I2N1]|nr:hypothetical protein B0G77_3377 [Paraburkholderia sp. BL10I2N1]